MAIAAGMALTACGVTQLPSGTPTSSAMPSVAVTASPSSTPVPILMPTATPIPTPIPTRAPAPTLNPTAANDLSQIRDLVSTVATEQTLVRSRCSYLTPWLASSCEFIVNQAGGYHQEIPQGALK